MKFPETTNHDEEPEDADSADEALCEMLGLPSLDSFRILNNVDNKADSVEGDGAQPSQASPSSSFGIPHHTPAHILFILSQSSLPLAYRSESVAVLPHALSVPARTMRRLTDELVWGSEQISADRTHETVRVYKAATGDVEERRVLTRLENFVHSHKGWRDLCHGYLRECVSALVGVDMVLFKEKLNLKPPGGSGFAPHLDAPSLRVALGDGGPRSFVTVMVAIDDMTAQNGCLRFVKGAWDEGAHCELVRAEEGGNPDGSGREGAIPTGVAEMQDYEDLVCCGGTIAVFSGWTPHRSGVNRSAFARRAVFLTYNPREEGTFRDSYYEKMSRMREDWRKKLGLGKQLSEDERRELDALKSIPRI